MTLYLAIDRVTDVAAPDGLIRGIAETTADLVAQGFPANTYRGNRRASIDETDSSVWNNDCIPGWYLVGGAVQSGKPLSSLERLKRGFRSIETAARVLSVRLADRGAAGWHSPSLVDKGNAWLYHGAFEASYMVGRSTALTLIQKTRFTVTGLAILNSILAEQNSETLYNNIEPLAIPTQAQLMVNLDTGQPYTFPNAVAITGGSNGYPDVPTSADLGGGSWIDDLTL